MAPGRKTFLIDKGMKIRSTYDNSLFASSHVQTALSALKKLSSTLVSKH